MADAYKKISDFTKASEFGDGDLLLVSQSGTTRALRGATLKEFAKAAGVEAAKINGASVNASGHLILTTTDGVSIDAGKVDGTDGVSVTNASIDAQYHLILTLSDGSTRDAGYCRGASGAGTGDMLQETYDPDGTVAGRGGIAQYILDETDYVWEAALKTTDYDPYLTVMNHGGIENYVKTLGRDASTPIGTIRTTIRNDYDTTCWMLCDGSEVTPTDVGAVWQMLYGKQGSFEKTFGEQQCVNALDYMTVTDPTRVFLEGVSDYRYFIAASGVSGGDVVLQLYGSRTIASGYTLLKTFTIAGQTEMVYPCAIAGSIYDKLVLAWAVQDNVKVYCTSDLETWVETEITAEDSVRGHKIDMCAPGSSAAVSWAICDCTNGTVYATQTPDDGTSWTKTPIPDECQGREIVSARLGERGQVIHLTSSSDNSYTLFIHLLREEDGSVYWSLFNELGYGSGAANYLWSRPFGWDVIYFADARDRAITLRRARADGWFDTVYIANLDDGCECTDVMLHGETPMVCACAYTDQNSEKKGIVLASMDTDLGFFRCCELSDRYPQCLYYNSGNVYFIDSNGLWRDYDYDNDTVSLPNISLSDDTVTLIKHASEEYAD